MVITDVEHALDALCRLMCKPMSQFYFYFFCVFTCLFVFCLYSFSPVCEHAAYLLIWFAIETVSFLLSVCSRELIYSVAMYSALNAVINCISGDQLTVLCKCMLFIVRLVLSVMEEVQ